MAELTVNAAGGGLTAFEGFVYRDEDWREVWRIYDGDAPYALAGCDVQVFVAPTFDFGRYFRRFAISGAEIAVTNAELGEVTLLVDRPTVIADLPEGAWCWVAVLIDGASTRELWRGPLRVFGGAIT